MRLQGLLEGAKTATRQLDTQSYQGYAKRQVIPISPRARLRNQRLTTNRCLQTSWIQNARLQGQGSPRNPVP
jgi:hypothetical protein